MSENKNIEEYRMETKRGIAKSLHPRYDWLDQFRGMVIVFLFIASITWELSSDNFLNSPPVGPTWLNHGFRYWSQDPEIITIVDLGSQIFMFMLGISLGLSFPSKIKKKGIGYAWSAVFHRIFTFFWLVQLVDWLEFVADGGEITPLKMGLLGLWFIITIIAVIFRNLKKYTDKLYRPLIGMLWALTSMGLWMIQARYPTALIGSGYLKTVFFGEALSHLAIGTLFAAIFVFLIKKPDLRIIVSIFMFIAHFVMWEFEGAINAAMVFWPKWGIPFDSLGMGAIAIAASCVWDWMNIDPDNQKEGMKKRVIPFFLIAGILHFIVDFFQPGDHHGINTSISLLAIAFSTLLVVVFFSLEFFFNFKIPFLTHLGRNALFLFLFQGTFTIPYGMIWDNAYNFRTSMAGLIGVVDLTHPFVNLMGLLAFIIPIMLSYFIAWLFDKLNWHIRV
jgi:hypothetical protein